MTTKIEALKDPVRALKAQKLQVQQTAGGVPSKLNILVYSAPGGGKTYFAGTFPKPLFVDCQGGIMTVRRKEIAYVQPSSYEELLQCVNQEAVSDYQTWVLDTGTEAARITMESSLELSGRFLPQQQDWGLVIERLRRYLRAAVELPMNVIVTCEERTVRDEDSGKVILGPALPGQLFHEAGALFDCVFHLRNSFNPVTKTKGRWLLTEPDGLYPAKDRTGCFEKLEKPDYETLWTKLRA